MQNPVKERIVKLREEIAQISEANRLYLPWRQKADTGRSGGSPTAASKIAGNPRRIGGAHRLEKAVSTCILLSLALRCHD
jgi:hypothetical protein